MGQKLALHQVDLEYFWKTLGSQNVRVLSDAMTWLENQFFAYWQDKTDREQLKIGLEICPKHLHRLIFEGKLVGKPFVWTDYRPSSLPHESLKLEDTNQYWLIECVLAIFASVPTYEKLLEDNRWRYTDTLKILHRGLTLTPEQEGLWNFLLKGRPLSDEKIVNTYQYYGHLTNFELKVFLDGLNSFYAEMQGRPEDETPMNWQTIAYEDFEHIYNDLSKALDNNLDLFFMIT